MWRKALLGPRTFRIEQNSWKIRKSQHGKTGFSEAREKTPFPAQNMLIPPGPAYKVPAVGGKFCTFTPPLLYHMVYCPSDPFKQMTSCLPEPHLPSNWITDEENSCYPVALVPVHNFLCTCTLHHAYLTIAHKIWVIFFSITIVGH